MNICAIQLKSDGKFNCAVQLKSHIQMCGVTELRNYVNASIPKDSNIGFLYTKLPYMESLPCDMCVRLGDGET